MMRTTCLFLALIVSACYRVPTDAAPPDKKAPPPAFDLKDATRTARWVGVRADAIDKFFGNEIAYEKAIKDFTDEMLANNGSTVTWRFTVKGVEKGTFGPTVRLIEETVVNKERGRAGDILCLAESDSINFEGPPINYLRIRPEDLAAKLRVGEVVTVTGQISGAKGSHGGAVIYLKEPTLKK